MKAVGSSRRRRSDRSKFFVEGVFEVEERGNGLRGNEGFSERAV
jgi:hypothetical protein